MPRCCKRSENVKSAPYSGFVNPVLEPVTDAHGNITDIRIEHPKDFVEQMLDYGKRFSFLPERELRFFSRPLIIGRPFFRSERCR
jgi:hypothetical protein